MSIHNRSSTIPSLIVLYLVFSTHAYGETNLYYTQDYEETMPYEDEDDDATVYHHSPSLLIITQPQQSPSIGEIIIQGIVQGIAEGFGYAAAEHLLHKLRNLWGTQHFQTMVNSITKTICSSFLASAIAAQSRCTLPRVMQYFRTTYGKFSLLGELVVQICGFKHPHGILDNAAFSAIVFGITQALANYYTTNKINPTLLFTQSGRIFFAHLVVEALAGLLTQPQVRQVEESSPTQHYITHTTTTMTHRIAA